MVTGASQADAAILFVSAKRGEFEAGIGAGGQTREHGFLAFTLGCHQMAVAVNKMDDPTVNWSQERYEEIKSEFAKIGYENMEIMKLRAEEFGVPQLRRRVFFIGSKKGNNIESPSPLFSQKLDGIPSPITVKEAIGKLVETFYNIMREHGLRWGTKTECGTQGANFEWTLAKDAFIFRVTSLMEWQMLFGDPEDLKHYEQED